MQLCLSELKIDLPELFNLGTLEDTSAVNVTVTPISGLDAENVQAALEELNDSKVAKTQSIIAGNGLTGGGTLSGDVTQAKVTRRQFITSST